MATNEGAWWLLFPVLLPVALAADALLVILERVLGLGTALSRPAAGVGAATGAFIVVAWYFQDGLSSISSSSHGLTIVNTSHPIFHVDIVVQLQIASLTHAIYQATAALIISVAGLVFLLIRAMVIQPILIMVILMIVR